MKTSSAKQKGRRLQQLIRNHLRKVLQHIDPTIQDDDVQSTPMGCSGVDVVLSPAATRVVDIKVEAKNCESLNVSSIFWKHFAKHGKSGLAVLIHAKNRTEATVTLRWTDFLPYLIAYSSHKDTDWKSLSSSLLVSDGSIRGTEVDLDTEAL